MVVCGDAIEHHSFYELPSFLRAGDVLVLNETRVVASRLHARRMPGGGRVELLLLHPADSLRYDPNALRWIALARPAKRLKAGSRMVVLSKASTEGAAQSKDPTILGNATVLRELPDGAREIAFDIDVPFETFLARAGSMPLPPYIHNDTPQAQERYQTVFAQVPGSVAAPTASLHFTHELLDAIARAGIEIVRIALDVGLGTFRPMTAERIGEHAMHAEAYAIPPEAVATIERAKREGRRVVAAGTTVVRALEGNARDHGGLVAGSWSTDLFIAPGFPFRIVDAMITNFHLPRSTLLVLVSAFAGRERMLRAYARARDERYRFFSFGDAMLIVP